MSQASEDLPFKKLDARIYRKYAHLLGLSRKSLFGLDIIESWESCRVVLPLLEGIVSATLTEDEFRKAIIKLEVNLWHLIDHLQRLKTTIESVD